MKLVHLITLVLLVIGGLNWGLVGLYGVDLVAVAFGSSTILANATYAVIGLAAVWQVSAMAALLLAGEPVSVDESPASQS